MQGRGKEIWMNIFRGIVSAGIHPLPAGSSGMAAEQEVTSGILVHLSIFPQPHDRILPTLAYPSPRFSAQPTTVARAYATSLHTRSRRQNASAGERSATPSITKYRECIQNRHCSGVTILPSVHRRLPFVTKISFSVIEQNRISLTVEEGGNLFAGSFRLFLYSFQPDLL